MIRRLIVASSLAAAAANAQDTSTVRFAGFADVYHAWDANRPAVRDRAFTTQPARHNEFNVNLAFVEGVLSGPRLRGRIALQAGTSVQSNYAGEPRNGSVSGPDLARHIQEAVVGMHVGGTVWVDAGIYFSHIGGESWISRDNLTYTRSLKAEYSPYYQSGAKVTWQPSPTITAQVNIVNGWQNISETNGDKAAGARVDWAPSGRATVSLYNFIGNERPDSAASQLRVFHGASVKLAPSERLTIVGTFDVGVQGSASWYGTALLTRWQPTAAVALVGRIERYDDPQQVIVQTGTSDPFRASGGSIGVDVAASARVRWRSEVRALGATREVFPDRGGASRMNAVVVTSLAATF